MKPLIILILICCFSVQIKAQNNFGFVNTPNVRFEFFDLKMDTTTDPMKVAFLRKITKIDSGYRELLYRFRGPQVYSKTYRDAELKELHGLSVYMNSSGNLDSAGYFKNNLRDGRWFYPLKNSYATKAFKEGVEFEMKTVSKDSLKGWPVLDSLEKIAEFPGGLEGWRNYLVKNFRYPQRAINLDKEGTVYVTFIIDKDGTLLDPYISRSIELSLDEASIGLIRKSPKWTPAIQHGQNVKCIFSQPIAFRLQ